MDSIGEKIRFYREKKGFSRIDFCDDEGELTTRQLTRIETGASNPTAATIQYIAGRLGLPSYRLMPDYQQLPADYKELKYLLLRQPVYSNPKLLEQHEDYLAVIEAEFYEQLPEDERFVIACLKAIYNLHKNDETADMIPLVEQYADEFLEKSYFTINDLPFFRVLSGYFSSFHKKGTYVPPKLALIFETSFAKLLKQADLFAINNLFIYENSILSSLIYYANEKNYSLFPESISLLKSIIEKTQHYQKKPLIFMLEWKVSFFLTPNLSRAFDKYHHAKKLATLLEDETLCSALEIEWQQDLEQFQKNKKNFLPRS